MNLKPQEAGTPENASKNAFTANQRRALRRGGAGVLLLFLPLRGARPVAEVAISNHQSRWCRAAATAGERRGPQAVFVR
jgi:hypothetical protein